MKIYHKKFLQLNYDDVQKKVKQTILILIV